MMHRIIGLFLAIAVLALAACSQSVSPASPPAVASAAEEPAAVAAPVEEAAGEAMLPEVNPLEVSGDIITAGSSTVFPLSEAMAERFTDEGYSGNITIDSIGTGAGFERFC